MTLGTIELLEEEVQRAEDQLRAGNAKSALDRYCTIFQERWSELGSRADHLTAADLTVLERIAEISIPFGFTAQADELFSAAAAGYLRLQSRYWFDYVTLKRVHLAFSSSAVFRARELLKTMRASVGDLESLSFDSDALASLEAHYTATRNPGERQVLFANLYLQLGRLAIVLGSYAGAVAAAQRGLKYAGTGAPLIARSACIPLRLTLARAQIEAGDLAAGFEELRTVRDEIEERSQPGLLCMWLEISAQLSLLRGDFGAAQGHLASVWRICLEHEFLTPALRAFLNLAQVLIVLNKTVEAKRLLGEVQASAQAIGNPEIETEAARLHLVAEARAQRDTSGPASVNEMQAGSDDRPQHASRLGDFRVTSAGLSFQDFQLRVLQYQFYLGSGREEAAGLSLQRLQLFSGSDSRLVQLGLAAVRATDLYFSHQTTEALLLLRQIAPAYRELGMRPDQWRMQVLWKHCLDQLHAPETEREALAGENESLLTEMADSLSIEEQIIFLLNKPTQQEEVLARKIRALQEAPVAQSGLYGKLLYLYRQATWLNSILDDVYWQREATAEIRLSPGAARARTRSATPLHRRLFSHRREHATLAFVVLPDSVLVVTMAFARLRYRIIRTSRLRIRELVRMWHEAIPESRPDIAARAARLLVQDLQLDSVLAELPVSVKRLRIIPDDALHGFPFAALNVGGQHLIERYAVSIGFQPNRRRVVRQGKTINSALVVGMTEGSPPLPKTRDQGNFVASWLSARGARPTLLFNEEAAPAILLGLMQQATLMHISCHGEYSQERPQRTGWQIVTAPGQTEILGLDRMFQLDLTRLRHATLISCWAADNFVLPARWILSLPEVLWRAGTGSVLGSLWQVSEDCADEFVRHFYAALPDRTVDCAMQAALLRMMRSGDGPPREPFDWAGFQVYGEPQLLKV